MGDFNINPFAFLERRGEQSALKKVIAEKLESFEENLAYAKIDWKKKPHERFAKMEEDELIALRQAVGVLASYMEDIKKNFTDLSPDVKEALDSIETLATSVGKIADPQEMKAEFEKRDMKRYNPDSKPYVMEPMSSQLDDQMHHLYMHIHKLKSAGFPSIFSGKIETEGR